jgi:hypothetical protein
MSSPIKITRDLRIIVPPDGQRLTASEALELGKRLLGARRGRARARSC